MGFIVKNTTIISPLDLIAPHSCRGCGRLGSVLCDRCKNNIIKQNHHPQPHHVPKNFPPIFAVGERTGLLDILIHDFKYDSVRALSPILAQFINATLLNTPNAIIVPIPTASSHIRARGLDHTSLLAKHLATLRHLKVQKILLRTENTTQVGSNRQARIIQADSAFTISPKAKINPSATYILLDDVWTTGASIQSAVKKLRQAGVNRIIIALLAISRLN